MGSPDLHDRGDSDRGVLVGQALEVATQGFRAHHPCGSSFPSLGARAHPRKRRCIRCAIRIVIIPRDCREITRVLGGTVHQVKRFWSGDQSLKKGDAIVTVRFIFQNVCWLDVIEQLCCILLPERRCLIHDHWYTRVGIVDLCVRGKTTEKATMPLKLLRVVYFPSFFRDERWLSSVERMQEQKKRTEEAFTVHGAVSCSCTPCAVVTRERGTRNSLQATAYSTQHERHRTHEHDVDDSTVIEIV